jgi:DNA-directed RNA polymerase
MTLTAQIERENHMAAEGARRVRKGVEKDMARGAAAETPAGVVLMKRCVGPVSDAIREFVQGAFTKKGAGRRNSVAVHLQDVDPDLAAFIAVKEALGGASRHLSLKTTAINIAHRLELELLANRFEEANEALYRAIIRNAKARGLAPERHAKAVQLAASKFGIADTKWTPTERVHIGTKLVELFAETGGPVELERVQESKTSKQIRLKLTERADEWFKKHNTAAGLARPLYLPAVCPPKPWTDVVGGSYFSPAIRERSVISRSFPGQLDLLRMGDMSVVYAGLNGLQETPWRINRRVFAVMQEAWDKELPMPCIPPQSDEPIPATPPEVEAAEKGSDVRKAWRNTVRPIHERNRERRSRRFEFARGLDIAKDNLEHEAIYFPHRCDFRGRAYAAATTLNPQGPDEIKALLEFGEGKPLGERGVFWLGVHGANLFGNDKVSLDERFQWAAKHWQAAVSVARNPLSNQWWTEADKPWSFLAWCFEWAEASDDYVSRLPIALDGSCNGIQHYSAMLRDEVGGAAVNLIPGKKPRDIYQTVADAVKASIAKIVEDDEHPEHNTAWGWHHFPIDRKVTKRPVMVLPYGGMFKSCMEYVAEAVHDKVKGGAENPFGDELRPASAWLAKRVWEGIDDTVVAARAAMSWLQKVARITSKHGVPLTWTAPSGFVVRQHYRKVRGNLIETRFNGKVISFRGSQPTDEIDDNRQASSVAPNFVHSMDAAAMMLTIAACREAGLRSFAMIHDSYGTHAADTDKLAAILRDQFVEMYLAHDVLAEFEASVRAALPEGTELPPRPETGHLDLEAVKDSAYFFA